jgi:hypothetical protein
VAGEIALADAFDLDHLGSEVGQVAAAQGRRDSLLEGDDAYAGQGEGLCGRD